MAKFVAWFALAVLVAGWWLTSTAEDAGPTLRLEIESDESRARTAAVFGGPSRSVTYRVPLDSPLEPEEIDLAATRVLRISPPGAIVGVRFVLVGWPRLDLDEATATSDYAWKLFWPGKTTVTRFSGTSPKRAKEQRAAFQLQPGETIDGIWIDHYSMIGLVAMTTKGGERFFAHVAMPEARYRLKPRIGPGPGAHFQAIEKITVSGTDAGKRYATDGTGADGLGVALRPDGSINVFGGRYHLGQKPFLKGLPFTP